MSDARNEISVSPTVLLANHSESALQEHDLQEHEKVEQSTTSKKSENSNNFIDLETHSDLEEQDPLHEGRRK